MRISDWSSDVCSSDLPWQGDETRSPAAVTVHDGQGTAQQDRARDLTRAGRPAGEDHPQDERAGGTGNDPCVVTRLAGRCASRSDRARHVLAAAWREGTEIGKGSGRARGGRGVEISV